MRRLAAGAAIGIVFGFVLSWSGMASPDVIRGALLLEESYLFLFFGSAVATAAIGLQVLRRRQSRASLVDAPMSWPADRPERRHIVGAVIFGVGWGVANACPGPIAAQIGQGVPWAVFTLIGVALGIRLHQLRERVETEPADRPAPSVRRGAAAEPAR